VTTDPGRQDGLGFTSGGAGFRAWLRRLPAEVNADLRSSLRITSPKSLARVIVAVVWVMTVPGLVLAVIDHGVGALAEPMHLFRAGCCLAVAPLLVLPARFLRYLFVLLACAGPWMVFVDILWVPTEAGRVTPALGLTVIPLAAFMMWGRRLGVSLTVVTMGVAALLGALRLITGELTLTLVAVIANIGLMLGWAAHTAERLEYDPLTGLANRRALERLLGRAVSGRRGGPAATFLAVLDVDGIRNLNEVHGRRVVDDILHRTGTTLVGRQDSGQVFHLGAGEFAVLLTGTRREAVEQLGTLRQPPVAGITMCAGMTAVDADTSPARLLTHAQASLARAKTAGPDALDPLLVDDSLVQELQHAVESGQFTVLYQPIVDLGTGTTVGCEALVRWDHPTRGRVVPDRFIPLAEQTALIHDIGRFVLREACAAVAAGPTGDRGLQYVSVNASPLELQRPDFGDDVLDCLETAGLDPRRLVLEVTESSVAGDQPEVAVALARLRQHGVRVAIDDFGTGYSSLSRLGQLPVDILKIDKSFVWATAAPTRDSVLAAIIGLAQAFGLSTVAEGIETWDHTDLLRGLGCSCGQGYLFGRPGSFDDLDLVDIPTDGGDADRRDADPARPAT
jgi:EAL domain-containing protein (putative c-di-GMP-specific phosphodiesterase class I)/GGDEF domain-containing protein